MGLILSLSSAKKLSCKKFQRHETSSQSLGREKLAGLGSSITFYADMAGEHGFVLPFAGVTGAGSGNFAGALGSYPDCFSYTGFLERIGDREL